MRVKLEGATERPPFRAGWRLLRLAAVLSPSPVTRGGRRSGYLGTWFPSPASSSPSFYLSQVGSNIFSTTRSFSWAPASCRGGGGRGSPAAPLGHLSQCCWRGWRGAGEAGACDVPAPPPQAPESVIEARSQGRRPSVHFSLKPGEAAGDVSADATPAPDQGSRVQHQEPAPSLTGPPRPRSPQRAGGGELTEPAPATCRPGRRWLRAPQSVAWRLGSRMVSRSGDSM